MLQNQSNENITDPIDLDINDTATTTICLLLIGK